MGFSSRVKAEDIRPEERWEFISLNDFHSTSILSPFFYAYLWASLVISVAVYGVDTFTAVNLLAYDRWTSEVDPFIPFKISKWIFSVCIIASLVNLAFEHMRAMRVIRRGAVAESYLDSLAARLQCTRFRSGWKRFLVFTELTRSKKGPEYVALFTYFSLQAWIRIVFCQGPRQVINALTLYSVLKLQYDSNQPNIGLSILTFFKNLGILADKDKHQALILSGMAFTLVIWGFGAINLCLALLAYILFLWHYIPPDLGLSRYCERKTNARLAQIVSVKVNKAIEEEERKRQKADARAIAKGDMVYCREATLPKIFGPSSEVLTKDKFKTTDIYQNWASTPTKFVNSPNPMHEQKTDHTVYRSTITNNYEAKAPLLYNPADIGYSRPASPAPSLIPSDIRDIALIQNQDFNNSGWPTENLDRYRSPNPVSNISFRPENTSFPRKLDNPHSNFNYQVGNPFLDKSSSLIFSGPETSQSMVRHNTASSMRTPTGQPIQRLGSPSPYYNGQF